jgi:hypothetical protein
MPLILLDKNQKDFYGMNLHEQKPTHGGFDRSLHSTIVERKGIGT